METHWVESRLNYIANQQVIEHWPAAELRASIGHGIELRHEVVQLVDHRAVSPAGQTAPDLPQRGLRVLDAD